MKKIPAGKIMHAMISQNISPPELSRKTGKALPWVRKICREGVMGPDASLIAGALKMEGYET